jgi:hypothetical protein
MVSLSNYNLCPRYFFGSSRRKRVGIEFVG